MSLIGKTLLTGVLGAIAGSGLFLWSHFGGAVYAAYVAGALMACF